MSRRLLSIIFKREYLKTVRKPSFWAATLLLPVVMAVLIGVMQLSSSSAEELDLEGLDEERIAIVDNANLIERELLNEQFDVLNDKDEAVAAVKNEDYKAAFIYSEDTLQERSVELHVQTETILERGSYNSIAVSLLTQSILAELDDPDKTAIINGDIDANVFAYEGSQSAESIGNFIVPGILAIGFMALILLSSNYLILSLSEEKENRLTEIMDTIVDTKTFITGKILSQVSLAFTQLAVVGGLILFMYTRFSEQMPIDITLSGVEVNPAQLILGIFYVVIGYLILAVIMVGIGALMPSAREAASFSGPFIFLSISPVYFLGILLSEPEGTVAYIASYIPFTAAPILLIRNALDALPVWEIYFSIVVLLLYLLLLGKLAVVLYKIGGIEYQQKLTPKEIFKRLRSH